MKVSPLMYSRKAYSERAHEQFDENYRTGLNTAYLMHQSSVLLGESVNQANRRRMRILGELGIERNLAQTQVQFKQ